MMNTDPLKPSLALWFRYGSAEHAELFYALPGIIKTLSQHFNVYYIGLKSREKPTIPEEISKYAKVIQIPIFISRRNNRDKTLKTLLWILLIPLIALCTRLVGIRYVYVEETMPLVMPIGRIFFGNHITMTLADLFLEQYFSKGRFSKYLGQALFNIDRWAWNKAPLLFTRSVSAKAVLNNMGIETDHTYYAYDAVDPQIYHPYDRNACRLEWDWAEDEIVMVYHGVLNPAKDIDTTLDALPRVVNAFSHFRFLIIGNGPEERRLRNKVSDMGLSRHVHFAGYMDPVKVATALGGADIGLISRKANLGSQMVITSVLGHCMACGLAIIAAKTDGIAELVVDGKNGLLYEPENIENFRQQLLRLCSDLTLRQQIAKAGLRTAHEKLSLEETVARNTAPLIDLWGTSS